MILLFHSGYSYAADPNIDSLIVTIMHVLSVSQNDTLSTCMIDAFVAERLFDVDVLMSLSYAQDASVCAQRNKEQEANYSISTLLARIYNDKLGNAEQAIFYLKESAEYADSPMQWLYINNRLGIIEGERGNVTLVLDHFKKTLEDAESCESGCAG